eukprot:2924093-Rhodomonas_salina.4
MLLRTCYAMSGTELGGCSLTKLYIDGVPLVTPPPVVLEVSCHTSLSRVRYLPTRIFLRPTDALRQSTTLLCTFYAISVTFLRTFDVIISITDTGRSSLITHHSEH